MQNEPTLDDIPRCSAIGSSTKSLYLCGFAGILKHGVPQGTIRTTWLLRGRPGVRIPFGAPDNNAESLCFQRFMFIGTQCDLWGRPDGTGHEKIGRGNFPRLILLYAAIIKDRHLGEQQLRWRPFYTRGGLTLTIILTAPMYETDKRELPNKQLPFIWAVLFSEKLCEKRNF